MITKVDKSQVDRERVKEVKVDKSVIEDDFFDYSKAVVKKPWGYEYLIYENDFVKYYNIHLIQVKYKP